jgi:hypothetical protein
MFIKLFHLLKIRSTKNLRTRIVIILIAIWCLKAKILKYNYNFTCCFEYRLSVL